MEQCAQFLVQETGPPSDRRLLLGVQVAVRKTGAMRTVLGAGDWPTE